MLDVHPPHESAHTWKDFFIHIATIVVGLIIAVGLEQAVEYVHNCHEITQTREALRLERQKNIQHFREYSDQYLKESSALQANMAELKSLSLHPQPGPIYINWYHLRRNQFEHAAWDTAQQSGVLNLMPANEVLRDQNLTMALADISRTDEDEWTVFNDVVRYMFSDPNLASLPPARMQEQIALTEKLMVKHFQRGKFLQDPPKLDSGFPTIVTNSDAADFHNATPCQAESCFSLKQPTKLHN